MDPRPEYNFSPPSFGCPLDFSEYSNGRKPIAMPSLV